jgi:signal transduction histidine kinase
MQDTDLDLVSLSQHLSGRREAILQAWKSAIKRDPALTTGDSLPRGQLFDHIPAMLSTFERELLKAPAAQPADGAGHVPAAAHGLQRWRQGYDLREVTRELGKLNECVVVEIDMYTAAKPHISQTAMATARRIWAALCSTGIEESVGQFFELQQQEAAGHVKDLESALADIQQLEEQRADLWRQAAHDLRGNLGVVANATVGLTHSGLRESSRDHFVRVLMRNVTSLHHLLDDVTGLARLQAGREQRRVEPLDVTPILQQLCEGIRPLAQQRHLFLRCEGPPGFATDGDAVKVRRIAQNLILNAVKFTRKGGITVSWGDSDAHDPKRWALCVQDTGPGFHTSAGKPMAQALETKSGALRPGGATVDSQAVDGPAVDGPAARGAEETQPSPDATGEGIGLSIVKRLCDMLDATIEMNSVVDVGTTFRILFPRKYGN